mmetsp:Transcript_78051/g.188478  ORF Transcript_78051/g.188478 Transcript_78051/m.188478 type:complete len:286 (-) Transcript_78051:345-1202(-)
MTRQRSRDLSRVRLAQLFAHGVAKGLGAARLRSRRGDVCRADAGGERARDGGLDGGGHLGQVEGVAQHHRRAQDLRHRVGHVETRQVGRGAAARLVHVLAAAEAGRGHQAERARQHRGGVGEDVAEEVLRADDVEVRGRLDELHRRVVDVHELELHLGVLRRHLRRHAPPEPARVEHVGLVDDGQPAAPLLGRGEGELERPADLLDRVLAHVGRLVALRLVLAEVEAAQQLPDDDHVHALLDDIGAERRGVRERGVDLGGAHVHRQVEGLAHAEHGVLLRVLPLG